MNYVYITFQTVTASQRAAAALLQYGITSEFQKAPKSGSPTGCAYALRLQQSDAYAAVRFLQRQGIRFERLLTGGTAV